MKNKTNLIGIGAAALLALTAADARAAQDAEATKTKKIVWRTPRRPTTSTCTWPRKKASSRSAASKSRSWT